MTARRLWWAASEAADDATRAEYEATAKEWHDAKHAAKAALDGLARLLGVRP